ncbi:MAG TPA: GIY-YIG nuclease family protein [Chloroflexota bacterium]|nr:GIY-YIG nuclease family protein [Chloroflexota bacterium]
MATHVDVLRQTAQSLPQAPGVYFWRDADGRILYIGKAVNLRARVSSYFSSARGDRRTRELIGKSWSISFEVTATELEALFRESALIKREQPPYNRALKRARRPFYLKLDGAHPDPYLEMVRDRLDDGSLYFGPFPSAAVTRETLAFVHDILPLRKCAAARPRCRPCLYFQMRTCAAPLLDEEHRRRHQETIERLFDLLDGRQDRVWDWLEAKRNRLSELWLFEQAAEIQARLDVLRDHHRQQLILEAAIRCRCVLIRDEGSQECDARALLVAHGHVLGVRSLSGLDPQQLAQWIAIHQRIADSTRDDQSEIDAASVLQRWLRCNRERVRWVAIRGAPSTDYLLDCSRYILEQPVARREPVRV